jgi:ORF6N domain-containing protein
MSTSSLMIPTARIEQRIFFLRKTKIMLSSDLAELYGVPVKVLNQAVKRNRERFPKDFMFQLTPTEFKNLKSQFVTSSWGGARSRPYAFSEHGILMLSSVLRSPRAIQVNIEIMRAFVRLRQMLASNLELAHKLEQLEKKYDRRFKVVFQAIRQLMVPSLSKTKPIGFRARIKS